MIEVTHNIRLFAILPTTQTVINIHIAKQMALSRTRQPYHEYALLTETKDESPVSTVPPHLEPFEDHDYDELYFEPACKEEELLSQLRKLGVPIIPREALKYVQLSAIATEQRQL